jgi:hypothetical protein
VKFNNQLGNCSNELTLNPQNILKFTDKLNQRLNAKKRGYSIKSQLLHELTAWLSNNAIGNWEYEAKEIDGEFVEWVIYFSDKVFFVDDRQEQGHDDTIKLLTKIKEFYQNQV